MSKTIKIPLICWKITQNWEKIWKISSWYPFSPNILQRLKKCQKQSKILKFVGKSPKIERKFGKFHLDILIVIIQPKTLKNVKICQKLGKKIKFIQKILQIFFGKFFFKIFQNKCQNWPPHGLIMKNDISHAGNMLRCDFPVLSGFYRILPDFQM